MNRLQLLYVLSIFIASNQCGLCQEFTLQLLRVVISNKLGNDVSKENVQLHKNNPENKYYFNDTHLDAVCHGLFSPSDIEIRSAHEASLSFSLIKQNDVYLVVTCEFADKRDLQKFFNDIRKQDKTVHQIIPLTGLFRYPINRKKYPNSNLTALTTNSLFYKKDIHMSKKVGANASLYLVSATKQDGIELEEADLVFLSEKFSVTLLIGMNKYGICIEDFPDFVFILRFRDHRTAVEFMSTVIDHVRMDGVHCPLSWLTEKQKTWMDTI